MSRSDILSTEAGHPELPDSDWSVSIEAESTEVSYNSAIRAMAMRQGQGTNHTEPKDKAVVGRSSSDI